MKTQILKYAAAMVLVVAVVIVSCNKKTESEQSPVVEKTAIDRKSVTTCSSSENLSETKRAKIGDGTVIEMVIMKDVAGMVTVTTTPTATLPSDRSSLWVYDADMDADAGIVSVPDDGKKYWMVYFDPTIAPALVAGGGSVTYTCDCNIEGTQGCEVTIQDCTADCQNGNPCMSAGAGCCLESDKGTGIVRSGALMLEAVSINFNGVVYQ